jgi:hypothetical protein
VEGETVRPMCCREDLGEQRRSPSEPGVAREELRGRAGALQQADDVDPEQRRRQQSERRESGEASADVRVARHDAEEALGLGERLERRARVRDRDDGPPCVRAMRIPGVAR